MNGKRPLLPRGYLLVFILFLSLFYAIRFKGHLLTEYLYQNQKIDILNKITGAHGEGRSPSRSLDFYIGEMENALLGPLQSVVSGLLFLSFCLRFLKKADAFQFGAAVLGYLFLSRPETLSFPPMGEGITGPFSDSVWLVQNNLNYFGLLKEDTFTTGGPQIYPTALYPFCVAVLMKLLPDPLFLITLHILYFLMFATTLTLIREIAKKTFPNDELPLFIAVLILYLPLSQCMVELLNLEVPCVFFTTLAAYYLIRDKMAAASLSALAALFVKDPGIVACIAVLFFTFCRCFFQVPPRDYRKLIWPVIIIIVAITKSYLRAMIVGKQPVFNMVAFLAGWQNIWPSIWFYVYLFSLIIVLAFAIRNSKGMGLSFKEMLSGLFERHLHMTVMFVLTTLWFLLFLNFLTLAYRYQLLLMPFLIFSAGYALTLLIKNKILVQRVLIGFIIFSLISSHGLMYLRKPRITQDSRTECEPTDMERSLEYRNFVKLQIRLAKEIEQNYSDYSIVAPFQIAQSLGLPELGYVSKKLDVTVYAMRATLGLRTFLGLKHYDLRKTVFIGLPHQRLAHIDIPYPIDPQDRILKRIESGHVEADIFMGGIAIERMRILVSIFAKQKETQLEK